MLYSFETQQTESVAIMIAQYFRVSLKTHKSKFFLSSIVILGVFFVINGCQNSIPSEKLPPWVINSPSGCAMGSLQLSGSLSLSKTGAIARARDSLARQIQTRVEGVLRTFLAEGDQAETSVKDEVIVDHTQQATSAILQGTDTQKTYLSSGSPKTVYVLVCLQKDQVLSMFEGLSFIPPQRQGDLRQRAAEAFSDLDELMKRYE